MVQERQQRGEEQTSATSRYQGPVRSLAVLIWFAFALTQIPVAAAHTATETAGLSPGHGIFLALIGGSVLCGAVAFKRIGRISPTVAIYGAFAGIVVTAFGAILFDGLSPDPTYTARTIPFPRSWYQPLALIAGLLISVLSFIVGWIRWPSRPRYTFLGILMGIWISYPYLVPGPASDSHPLGYALVVGTPLLVGYIIWIDAGDVLRAVLRDPVARRFGIGVGIVTALFFLTITGFLSFFSEPGGPHETTVVVLPVIYQIVTWPTLEIVLPHIPLFVAVSPGQMILVGSVSVLIGLNAALIAQHWRRNERVGMTEGAAGTAAIVGSCTCGCCGPLVAKIAVLAAGPSVAAPLYWVFVDSASPLSVLFIVGSIVLFAGSLIYSIESAQPPNRSTAVGPSD